MLIATIFLVEAMKTLYNLTICIIPFHKEKELLKFAKLIQNTLK